MKLIEQLLNEMGADTLKSFTVIPDFGGYFRSVKSVISFTPQKIILGAKRKTYTLEGENLQIGSYFENDILIKGIIKVITVE